MLGLLYKDYIAVKGKTFLMLLFGQFTVFTLLRFIVADNEEFDVMALALMFVIYTVLVCMISWQYAMSLIKADEGKKQKLYFLSLPVEKRQYVLSKYLFLGIAFYLLQSVFIFQLQVGSVNLVAEDAKKLLSSIQAAMPAFFSLCMLICALDLMFYFGLGVDRAKNLLNGLLFLLLFVVIVYFLFGDLSLVEHFDIISLMTYLQKHVEVMYAVQILFPVVAMLAYYISYRISVKLFERREWEDE